MNKPLTLRQVFKRETWTNRVLIAVSCAAASISAVSVALLLLVGALSGDWRWSAMSSAAGLGLLSWMAVQSVYWPRRVSAQVRTSPILPSGYAFKDWMARRGISGDQARITAGHIEFSGMFCDRSKQCSASSQASYGT